MSIRIAIAGIGNCASSLVQGIAHYRDRPDHNAGLMHPTLGGYSIRDIEVVAAFDVDARKVGQPLNAALTASPNNTAIFRPLDPAIGPIVAMGPVLDGIAPHTTSFPESQRVVPARAEPTDIASLLHESGAEILLNYMPVGAQRATEYYAQACLDAGVAFVNCVPCFVVSDPAWAKRFSDRGLPCVGDDIKAQVGATICHRTLARLFVDRGVTIEQTYQLNTGGNTDFLNMLARERLTSKKTSKTEAVQSQLDVPLDPDRIHVGPSDYVPFLKDNKVCFLRLEGTGFGGVPLHIEARLSVEDSPNSAAVVVDAILATRIALDAKVAGPILPACAWTMKHPPTQMIDRDALDAFRAFATAPGQA